MFYIILFLIITQIQVTFSDCWKGPLQQFNIPYDNPGCTAYDYNFDKKIDLSDYQIYQNIDPTRTADIPDSWLILFNKNNPDSITWKEYYQDVWDIPEENFLPLNVSNNETITRDDYINTIFNPVVDFLKNNKTLNSRIMGILVGYRVPGNFYTDFPSLGLLRVPDGPGGYSVASNLCCLWEIGGTLVKQENVPVVQYVPIPQRWFNVHLFDINIQSKPKLTKKSLLAGNYLTARIDPPSLTDAIRMSPQMSIISHGKFYYDYNDNGASPKNWESLEKAVNSFPGWEWLQFDSDRDAMTDCSFVFSYYQTSGWHRNNWSGHGSRILGYAMNSYGATTTRSVNSERFVPNCINKGVFYAAIGATGEPLYGSGPEVNTLIWCIKNGRTLGEAFYQSNRRNKWMWELQGDPLIRINFQNN